jgi:hypothetical protein
MAECPQCGATNPAYAVYCGKCGQELPEDFRKRAAQEPIANDARPPGPPQDFSGPVRRATPSVRPSGERLDVPRAVLTPVPSLFGTRESHRLELNPNPMIGGNCAIAAGFLGVIQGMVLVSGGPALIDLSTTSSGLQIVLGLIGIAFGFLSILGGLDARLHMKYRQSLTRAILGMVAFGFVIGAALGLVAVILIALSQDEFDQSRI